MQENIIMLKGKEMTMQLVIWIKRVALGNRGYLMPIIFDRSNIWIAPNEIFYTAVNAVQIRGRTWNEADNNQKELRSTLPNFQIKVFHKWMKVKLYAQNYQNELIFYPYNYYGSFGQVGYPVMRFESVSPVTKNYKEWLDTDNILFMKPYIRKYQRRLSIVKNCLIKIF